VRCEAGGVRQRKRKGEWENQRIGKKEFGGKEEFKRRRRPNILDYVFRRIA
jgi:hypothetical protein